MGGSRAISNIRSTHRPDRQYFADHRVYPPVRAITITTPLNSVKNAGTRQTATQQTASSEEARRYCYVCARVRPPFSSALVVVAAVEHEKRVCSKICTTLKSLCALARDANLYMFGRQKRNLEKEFVFDVVFYCVLRL